MNICLKIHKPCTLSVSLAVASVTRCCAPTRGRGPTGLSLFGVHLERGHRYGMHTSPGGCWCHCGTCPLHSQPLSTARIYLHSLLFSRELNWKQRRIGCLSADGSFLIARSLSCMIFANNVMITVS